MTRESPCIQFVINLNLAVSPGSHVWEFADVHFKVEQLYGDEPGPVQVQVLDKAGEQLGFMSLNPPAARLLVKTISEAMDNQPGQGNLF